MLDSSDEKRPNIRAIKGILVLAACVVLALLLVRLAGLFTLVSEVLSGRQLLRVDPDVAGDFWLAVGIGLALLAFLLPASLRIPAWVILFTGTLLLVALGGNQATPGGTGLSSSPVGHWLRAQGYARCTAHDQIRNGLHSVTVAEGWAQPGACPARPGTSAEPAGDAGTPGG